MTTKLLLVLAAFALTLVVITIYEQYHWPTYRDEHGCVETGETKSETMTTCNTIGGVVICSPHTYTYSKWVCDDGVTWR